jgi:drug/metabolite transporter (DMT)-like permease
LARGRYQAERYVPSGPVAVLFSAIVFMNPIGSRLAFRTPLSMRVLGAGAPGLAGVCLLFLLFLPELEVARAGGDTALGVAYGLGSTLLACGGNMVALRNHRMGLPVFEATTWGMACGAVPVVALALSTLFEGYRWTSVAALGAILAVAGNWLAPRAARTRWRRDR